MLLISRLAPHSVGTLRLRSIHKSKLAWRIIVNLSIPSATCGLSLQAEARCLIAF
jgi:hypothetical protein